MFRSVRLRLIGYVVGVLTLVLLAVGVVVYVLFTRQLDVAVDARLRAMLPPAPRLAVFTSRPNPEGAGVNTVVGPVLAAPTPEALPGEASVVAPPGMNGVYYTTGQGVLPAPPTMAAGIIQGGSPAGIAIGTGALQVGPPTVTSVSVGDASGAFLVSWSNGKVVGGNLNLPVGLPFLAAIKAARPGHDDERTVSLNGRRYRLLTRVLPDPTAGSNLVMQGAVSLAARDREQETMLLALAGGGMLGLLLTVAGGVFLTGRALAPLQLAFERQRRFVGDASHELRTPLALIRLEAEDLTDRLDATAEARPLLRQLDRAARLVDNLLTLARLDNGAMCIEREPVHVASLLEAAASAARRLAVPAVIVTHAAPPDLWVAGDHDRLYEVLLILIDNACRVTPEGGSIALAAGVVRQAHHEREGAAVLTVTDSGPGIPAEHAARVFERFYRVDRARSRAHGGTGLGLAIAREIVEAHGGSIAIVSPPGGGTTVNIHLPLLPAPALSEPDDIVVERS